MVLVWIIILLATTGFLAWMAARWNPRWSRVVSLAGTLVYLIMTITRWWSYDMPTASEDWILHFSTPWIPALGIHFTLALDGLSLLMLILTAFLAVICVLVSWNEIKKRAGFFYFYLLMVLTGITGVCFSLDLLD